MGVQTEQCGSARMHYIYLSHLSHSTMNATFIVCEVVGVDNLCDVQSVSNSTVCTHTSARMQKLIQWNLSKETTFGTKIIGCIRPVVLLCR